MTPTPTDELEAEEPRVAIYLLRSGDQVRYLGDWLDVVDVQGLLELGDAIDDGRRPVFRKVAVITDEAAGPPYELVGLDGEVFVHQPRRTLLLEPALELEARTMAELDR